MAQAGEPKPERLEEVLNKLEGILSRCCDVGKNWQAYGTIHKDKQKGIQQICWTPFLFN